MSLAAERAPWACGRWSPHTRRPWGALCCSALCPCPESLVLCWVPGAHRFPAGLGTAGTLPPCPAPQHSLQCTAGPPMGRQDADVPDGSWCLLLCEALLFWCHGAAFGVGSGWPANFLVPTLPSGFVLGHLIQLTSSLAPRKVAPFLATWLLAHVFQ